MTAVRMPKSFIEVPDFVPQGYRPPCRDVDPDLFFPVGSDPGVEARAVCRGCELRQECADWAVDADIWHGLWGGLDPTERRAVQRRRELVS